MSHKEFANISKSFTSSNFNSYRLNLYLLNTLKEMTGIEWDCFGSNSNIVQQPTDIFKNIDGNKYKKCEEIGVVALPEEEIDVPSPGFGPLNIYGASVYYDRDHVFGFGRVCKNNKQFDVAKYKIEINDDMLFTFSFMPKNEVLDYHYAIQEASLKNLNHICPEIFPEKANNTIQIINDLFTQENLNAIHERHLPCQFGILLYGLPGSGKSMFVKYLSELYLPESQCQRITYDEKEKKTVFQCTELETEHPLNHVSYVNTANISNFQMSGLPKSGIVVLDDMEQYLHERSFADSNSDVLNWLLNELDSGDRSSRRLIIFVTNHPEDIDDALMRPGRVDIKINFPKPNSSKLVRLLQYHVNDDIDKTLSEKIIRYLETKIKDLTYAHVSLMCRIIYTSEKFKINLLKDWQSVIDLIESDSAYRGSKRDGNMEKTKKMGFV